MQVQDADYSSQASHPGTCLLTALVWVSSPGVQAPSKHSMHPLKCVWKSFQAKSVLSVHLPEKLGFC